MNRGDKITVEYLGQTCTGRVEQTGRIGKTHKFGGIVKLDEPVWNPEKGKNIVRVVVEAEDPSDG